MSWTRSVDIGLSTHLAGAGIGLTYRPDGAYTVTETGIVHKRMPPSPDRVVVLTSYVVSGEGSQSDLILGIQARCRGVPDDPHDVDDIADDLYAVLHGAANLWAGDALLASVWRQSHTSMGSDTAHRWETSSNFYAVTAHHSAHALD
ncbi:hypothetical protein CLV30_12821 [Haloactinopolyspora alba]|uniref:Uncharacterized protein n=1 Tax=Haloactinopolyspora alba TaxID=648780 RepID=A0A2P8DEY8_9ACTN|nr:minor capsid protein [Haloactinopolyspora alba]PSK95769.1 hypothetical protein CLV30_12821 [Haloactinopolyspora alba]